MKDSWPNKLFVAIPILASAALQAWALATIWEWFVVSQLDWASLTFTQDEVIKIYTHGFVKFMYPVIFVMTAWVIKMCLL